MSAVVTEPGVHGLPADEYHADVVPGGSLSVSGVKLLLPPSCPAIYDWSRRNPPAPKSVFDFGHAAHTLVLGAGPPIVEVDADSWRTKAANEASDAARAVGATPLLAKDAAVVRAMAEQLQRHPTAAALFDPAFGNPEQALFALDPETGVMLRGMLDWLPNPADVDRDRYVIPDYKTTAGNGDPAAFEKSMADYGYHRQAAWYMDLVRALDIDDEPAFVFVVQSKVAPYLVSVIQPDSRAVEVGREENRAGIDLYARCRTAGHWPAFGEQITLAGLPPWYTPRLPGDTP